MCRVRTKAQRLCALKKENAEIVGLLAYQLLKTKALEITRKLRVDGWATRKEQVQHIWREEGIQPPHPKPRQCHRIHTDRTFEA